VNLSAIQRSPRWAMTAFQISALMAPSRLAVSRAIKFSAMPFRRMTVAWTSSDRLICCSPAAGLSSSARRVMLLTSDSRRAAGNGMTLYSDDKKKPFPVNTGTKGGYVGMAIETAEMAAAF